MAESISEVEERCTASEPLYGRRNTTHVATAARSYYTLTRSYPMAGVAKGLLRRRSPIQGLHHSVREVPDALFRPPRPLPLHPFADTSQQRCLIPSVSHATVSTGQPCAPPVATAPRTATMPVLPSLRSPPKMPSAGAVEPVAQPTLRASVQNTRIKFSDETSTNPFCVNGVVIGRLPTYGPATPRTRAPPRCTASPATETSSASYDTGVSRTSWEKAAAEADVRAFFNSPDAAVDGGGCLLTHHPHETPLSGELSSPMGATFHSSCCDLSLSDDIFLDCAAVSGSTASSTTVVARRHVIDQQAVFSFSRDGAHRQHGTSAAVSGFTSVDDKR